MAYSKTHYARKGWKQSVLDSIACYREHPERAKANYEVMLNNVPKWVDAETVEAVKVAWQRRLRG